MKRLFDIVMSASAILALSPLLVPVMLALRFSGEGEVFYRQQRLGRGGKLFPILKFATMLKDSAKMSGGDVTVAHDPRILPMGKFLRDTKINELPQLFNILLGDMSIIGPRPLTPRVAALFPPAHWEAVKDLRPGLSGIGSVVFRDEETLLAGAQDRMAVYQSLIVPYKMALEAWYAAHASLWVDLKIIFLTVAAILHVGPSPQALLPGLPSPSAELRDRLPHA
jgi:lipopolysaccharide/colanic/teichoic acid biosynthesis glycosyltransferase